MSSNSSHYVNKDNIIYYIFFKMNDNFEGEIQITISVEYSDVIK